MSNGADSIRRGLTAVSSEQPDPIHLGPGMDLFPVSFSGSFVSVRHEPLDHVLLICWCRAGQAVWTMGGGQRICLNPGNISLHSMCLCADSQISFPTDLCQGQVLCVDTEVLSAHPPELLTGAENLGEVLREKYCAGDHPVFLTGDRETERMSEGICNPPDRWRLPYLRLRVLELLLFLAEAGPERQGRQEECPADQVEIVRRVHEELLLHMEKRITIEELSRKYLINPTTLKAAFKSVYGTSLAAHIREHRMEQAAKLLRTTEQSIAEIAQAVGYDSQSRFTSAFKAVYHMLPREYRKQPPQNDTILPCCTGPTRAQGRVPRSGAGSG